MKGPRAAFGLARSLFRPAPRRRGAAAVVLVLALAAALAPVLAGVAP